MEIMLDTLLKEAVMKGASDLHILPGRRPMVRVQGSLMPLNGKTQTIDSKECFGMLKKILRENELSILAEKKTLDYSLHLNGNSYRINIHMDRGDFAFVARIVPPIPVSPRELNLPVVCESFTDYKTGLFIVTGPTGHGKSTTVACVVNLINERRAERIMILEDSLEFIHKDKRSIVVHQQVGRDCLSLQEALRSIMRQDPDVIVVGEIRDRETMRATLDIAESGHLVIATMHSFGVEATLDRIINFFPPEHQSLICYQLSVCLRAVISQILVPIRTGERVPACEVLVNSKELNDGTLKKGRIIPALLRERRLGELTNIMSSAGKEGMITMKKSLGELWQKRLIEKSVIDEIRGEYNIEELDV